MKRGGGHIRVLMMVCILASITNQVSAQDLTFQSCVTAGDSGVFDLYSLLASELTAPQDTCEFDVGVAFTTDTTDSVVNAILNIASFSTLGDTVYAWVSDVTGDCDSAAWMSIELVVDPFPVVIQFTDTLCSGGDLVLTIGPAGSGPWDLSWTWTSNMQYAPPIFAGLGGITDPVTNDSSVVLTYDLNTIVDTNTRCSISPDTTLFISPAPSYNVLSNDTICSGDSLKIAFSPSGSGPWTLIQSNPLLNSPVLSDTLELEMIIGVNAVEFELQSVVDRYSCQFDNTSLFVINPIPSIPTFTAASTLCNNIPLNVSEFVNTDTVFYAWSSSTSADTGIVDMNGSLIVPLAVSMGNDQLNITGLVSADGCMLDTLVVHNLAIVIAPQAQIDVLTQHGDSTNGGMFCIGQTLMFAAISTITNNYNWSLPSGMVSQDTISQQLTATLTDDLVGGDLILTQSNAPCNAFATTPITATNTLCNTIDIYQFPGEVFIAVMQDPQVDNLQYHKWRAIVNGAVVSDTTLSSAVYIWEGMGKPDSIEIIGSYTASGVCECRSALLTPKDLGGKINETLIYPNPVQDDRFNIVMPRYFTEQEIRVRMVDLRGAVVHEEHLPPGSVHRAIELPAGLKGIYLLELRSALHFDTQKVIVK